MLFLLTVRCSVLYFFFFFNDTATTEIYTLSLHDALPISRRCLPAPPCSPASWRIRRHRSARAACRSEEHTSELQSRLHLVCRLLLEKKKKKADIRRGPAEVDQEGDLGQDEQRNSPRIWAP